MYNKTRYGVRSFGSLTRIWRTQFT